MTIDNETLYFTVEPLLRQLPEEEIKRIKEAAPRAIIGRDGYLSLTIADLSRMIDGHDITGIILNAAEPLKLTVFEWYTAEGLRSFLEGYIQKLEALQPPLEPAERAAQKACLTVTTTEGLLCFAREYFGLHSFSEAEGVTLAEILIAKKDSYNKVIYQKAFIKQQQKRRK